MIKIKQFLNRWKYADSFVFSQQGSGCAEWLIVVVVAYALNPIDLISGFIAFGGIPCRETHTQ